MPIAYERDDQRRLITVTVTEPCSADDIIGVIDRQAAEDTWGYSMLYDLRAVTQVPAADLPHVADRVRVAGAGRERGPVGLAIRATPALFQATLLYTALTKELVTLEVLLTTSQLDAWLTRNAPRRSKRGDDPLR